MNIIVEIFTRLFLQCLSHMRRCIPRSFVREVRASVAYAVYPGLHNSPQDTVSPSMLTTTRTITVAETEAASVGSPENHMSVLRFKF